MTIDYQTIMFGTGVLGTIFGVYNYFRNPQIKLEKSEYGFGLQLKNMQAEIANLRDNHIHTLDQKIDGVNVEMTSMKVEIGKLATIIDERIPKKNT